MDMLKRASVRLAGFRIYLLALVFALPDILSALVGFDWSTVLPAGYELYGAKIGRGIGLARLILVPALKSVRDAQRDAQRGPGPGPDGGSR